MNRRAKRQHRPMSDINIVPYIDVMLVLLVIFMITTPLLSQGVDVNLPTAKAKVIKAQDKQPIVVSVNATGQFFLNIAKTPDNPIDESTLLDDVQNALAEAKDKGESRNVLVKGDKDANYGKIVHAMVLLQQAGVADVGLVTQDNTVKSE